MISNESLKVLMIGNSFSICVLKYMPAIAKELGCNLDLTSLFIGGCELQRHAANIFAGHEYDWFSPYLVKWDYSSLDNQNDVPFFSLLSNLEEVDGRTSGFGNVPQILAAENWDIVTIQQASHQSWRPESFHPWVDLIITEIRKLASQAKIVIQETWSYSNMDSRIYNSETGGAGLWGIDQAEMYHRLSANYKTLADEEGLDIIPTGRAIQLFRKTLPVLDVTDDIVGTRRITEEGRLATDTIHLNPDGEYLQACVWTEKLFGADVRNLKSIPETLLKPENIDRLRKCAHEAVF